MKHTLTSQLWLLGDVKFSLYYYCECVCVNITQTAVADLGKIDGGSFVRRKFRPRPLPVGVLSFFTLF